MVQESPRHNPGGSGQGSGFIGVGGVGQGLGGLAAAGIDFSRGGAWLSGSGEMSDVVLSSRVRHARNLAGHSFMPRASKEERQEILTLCRRIIMKGWAQPGRRSGHESDIRLGAAGAHGSEIEAPAGEQVTLTQSGREGEGLAPAAATSAAPAGRVLWLELHQTPPMERALLVERHLISKPHAKGKLSSGRGGPLEPRGVAVVLPTERVSVMVNEEDHLRIQAIKSGLDVSGSLAAADDADDRIEAEVDYAFNSRFGYLTACPTNVGTGVRLSVMLHLPALKQSGAIDKVKRAADDLGLAIRGFYGEGSQSAGDLYQLSNQTTLGKSESVLLHEIEQEIVPSVVAWERQERKKLIQHKSLTTGDNVHRALGLLRSARIMGTDEAMKLLSRVRLGVVCGLIDGLSQQTVNELILLIHPAHLQRIAGREMNQAERQEARAKFLRERLAADTA